MEQQFQGGKYSQYYSDDQMNDEHNAYAREMGQDPRVMAMNYPELERRLNKRYPQNRGRMTQIPNRGRGPMPSSYGQRGPMPMQPYGPGGPIPMAQKKPGFFGNLFGKASSTVQQHFTPAEQQQLNECKMIVRNKGRSKMGGIMSMFGGKRRRTKSHKRKTHKRKTHKRKTHKRKTHKRKSHARKH